MKKRVRQFIEEHNSIPRTNHDKDLSRFYAQRELEAEKTTESAQLQRKPVWKSAWLWSAVSVVMILAIVLPIALSGRSSVQDTGDSLYFCDSAEIRYMPIDSQSAFNEKYNCDSSVRTNEESTFEEIFSEELNKVIGLKTDLFIYSDFFHEASVFSYIGSDRIAIGPYSTLEEQTDFNGLHVNYQQTHMAGMSVYYLNWSAGSIEYYATVLAYLDIDINDVVDQIFVR